MASKKEILIKSIFLISLSGFLYFIALPGKEKETKKPKQKTKIRNKLTREEVEARVSIPKSEENYTYVFNN
jgi:hypothetical protein